MYEVWGTEFTKRLQRLSADFDHRLGVILEEPGRSVVSTKMLLDLLANRFSVAIDDSSSFYAGRMRTYSGTAVWIMLCRCKVSGTV